MNFKNLIVICALLISSTWAGNDEINPENGDDLLSSSDESNDGKFNIYRIHIIIYKI